MQSTPPKLQVVDQLDPTKPEWYKLPLRPIAEILADLSKPIPNKYLDTRKQGGANLTYLPWYNAVKLLDRCTGGHWDYSITNIHTTSDRIFLVARITIHAESGDFSREATGTELLDVKFSDPSSKAESMALRRAAAKLGLALYLYDKDD
jgi:hypothetical protein